MGTGYKGGANHFRSIKENIPTLSDKYKFSNGLFGERGQGRFHVRNIESNNPKSEAKTFYGLAAYGGKEFSMDNGKGRYTKLSDGTIISYREKSSSDGTSVVEINISNSTDKTSVKRQKIHFVKEND